MRILIEGPVYDPSGIGKVTRNLALTLRYFGDVRIKIVSRWGGDLIEVSDLKILKKMEVTPMKKPYYHIQFIRPERCYPNPFAIATIGLCLFETDRIPLSWVIYGKQVNAVWSTSEFNHNTFTKFGLKNKLVPFCGVDPNYYRPNIKPLDNLHRKKFNFISNFEWTPRKGWDILLQAYWREFTPQEKVSLTIKAYFGPKKNRLYILQQIQELKNAMRLKEIPTTIVCTDIIPDDKMPNFYASGDCYVSASRGDGFGLGELEASVSGLPVIAPAWGGDHSYLPKENLISCIVEPVNSKIQIEICPSFLGGLWCKPSVENLKFLLRRAFQRKLLVAKKDKLRKYNWHSLAENIVKELAQIKTKETKGG